MTTQWDKRGEVQTTQAGAALIAQQTAAVIAAYCRQDSGDPDLYWYGDGDGDDEDKKPVEYYQDKKLLMARLREIEEFAVGLDIPFSVDFNAELARQMYKGNADIWENSSLSC